MTVWLAGERNADALLERDPLALLIGMLLDQQVPMERAFRAPVELLARLAHRRGDPVRADARLDPAEIGNYDPEALGSVFGVPPALHRYPTAMAGRVQTLCRHIVGEYGGDASRVWRDVPDGRELMGRVRALPGYGPQKSQVLVALLGKQFGVCPDGWREMAAAYGEPGSHRSIADVTDAESLAQVRASKKAAKALAANTKA